MAAKQLSTLQQAALEEKTARDEYEVAAKEAISKIALMDAKIKADAKLNSEREVQEAADSAARVAAQIKEQEEMATKMSEASF